MEPMPERLPEGTSMKTTIAVALLFSAIVPAAAGEIDVRSSIDAVTVYPDGATVTRHITVDLPAGETTLIARDFPPGLDAASLRVEGDSPGRVVIGSIDARRARPRGRPCRRSQAYRCLADDSARSNRIAGATASQEFAARSPDLAAGLGERARRAARRMAAAFAAVSEEIATADWSSANPSCASASLSASCSSQRQRSPPGAQDEGARLPRGRARATFRVIYAVRGGRWVRTRCRLAA